MPLRRTISLKLSVDDIQNSMLNDLLYAKDDTDVHSYHYEITDKDGRVLELEIERYVVIKQVANAGFSPTGMVALNTLLRSHGIVPLARADVHRTHFHISDGVGGGEVETYIHPLKDRITEGGSVPCWAVEDDDGNMVQVGMSVGIYDNTLIVESDKEIPNPYGDLYVRVLTEMVNGRIIRVKGVLLSSYSDREAFRKHGGNPLGLWRLTRTRPPFDKWDHEHDTEVVAVTAVTEPGDDVNS